MQPGRSYGSAAQSTSKGSLCLRSGLLTFHLCHALPKLCQAELQFRWLCGSNSINRSAVQINFTFELHRM